MTRRERERERKIREINGKEKTIFAKIAAESKKKKKTGKKKKIK